MKKRLRRLIVFAGVLELVMDFNLGTAFADHTGGTQWTCNVAPDEGFCTDADKQGPASINAFEPVGRHVFPGGVPITEGAGNAPRLGITNNPLCPLHEDGFGIAPTP